MSTLLRRPRYPARHRRRTLALLWAYVVLVVLFSAGAILGSVFVG